MCNKDLNSENVVVKKKNSFNVNACSFLFSPHNCLLS